MSAEVRLACLIAPLALWCMVHVYTVAHLFRRPLQLQGLLAALLPPIAPLFAWQRGHRARAVAWVTLAALYITARLFLG